MTYLVIFKYPNESGVMKASKHPRKVIARMKAKVPGIAVETVLEKDTSFADALHFAAIGNWAAGEGYLSPAQPPRYVWVKNTSSDGSFTMSVVDNGLSPESVERILNNNPDTVDLEIFHATDELVEMDEELDSKLGQRHKVLYTYSLAREPIGRTTVAIDVVTSLSESMKLIRAVYGSNTTFRARVCQTKNEAVAQYLHSKSSFHIPNVNFDSTGKYRDGGKAGQ